MNKRIKDVHIYNDNTEESMCKSRSKFMLRYAKSPDEVTCIRCKRAAEAKLFEDEMRRITQENTVRLGSIPMEFRVATLKNDPFITLEDAC